MKTAWLIEAGSPAIYYCNIGDWCSNANHACKFSSQLEAQKVRDTMQSCEIRVVEHGWYTGE